MVINWHKDHATKRNLAGPRYATLHEKILKNNGRESNTQTRKTRKLKKKKNKQALEKTNLTQHNTQSTTTQIILSQESERGKNTHTSTTITENRYETSLKLKKRIEKRSLTTQIVSNSLNRTGQTFLTRANLRKGTPLYVPFVISLAIVLSLFCWVSYNRTRHHLLPGIKRTAEGE